MQIVRLKDAAADTSYLFLVRLWRCEPADEGSDVTEWEGKVQHVRSGQAHGFESLPALVDEIQLLLRDLGPGNPHTTADAEFHHSE